MMKHKFTILEKVERKQIAYKLANPPRAPHWMIETVNLLQVPTHIAERQDLLDYAPQSFPTIRLPDSIGNVDTGGRHPRSGSPASQRSSGCHKFPPGLGEIFIVETFLAHEEFKRILNLPKHRKEGPRVPIGHFLCRDRPKEWMFLIGSS